MTLLGFKMTFCQRGFTVVSATFLLVVLAALGAAILSISAMQHTSSALDVQGSRAYQAARAGIEWGMYRQLINGSCAAAVSFVPPAPTLSAFTVTVGCVKYSGATPSLDVYRITSTACNQPSNGNCPGAAGSMNYVERQLQVTL